MGKKVRILSIDGGGLHAYFGLYALYRIEQDYNIKILDQFDAIIANSAGTLIGGPLCAGIELKTVLDMFSLPGKKTVFKSKYRLPFRGSDMMFSKYKTKNLDKILYSYIGDMSPDDAYKKIGKDFVFFSANFNNKDLIFTSPSHMGLLKEHYKDMTLRQGIISSCSAPSYFRPQNYKGDMIMDGGLYNNNPSIFAVYLGLNYYKKPLEDIEVVSIGHNWNENINLKMHNNNWKDKVKTFFYLNLYEMGPGTVVHQREFSTFLTKGILKENYYRYEPDRNIKSAHLDKISNEFKEYSKEYYEKNKKELFESIIKN